MNLMSIEEFDTLNFDEKECLMLHWWHYYGKTMYSLRDLENYREALSNYIDKIIEAAVIFYMRGIGPEIVARFIFVNKIEVLLNRLPKIEEFTRDEMQIYLQAKQAFINEIIRTSNYFRGR